MDTRKITIINKTYFVSLPKTWVLRVGLEKGGRLRILTGNNGALTITPAIDQLPVENEVTLRASRFVSREVVRNVLEGTEVIQITSDQEISDALREDIAWFVHHLPNVAIIDENSHNVTIQNFGYKNMPLQKMIRRLITLVSRVFIAVQTNDAPEVVDAIQEIRKFYFMIVGRIRTYLKTGLYLVAEEKFTPLEAMDCRLFCEKLIRIASILQKFDLNATGVLHDYLDALYAFFERVAETFSKNDTDGASLAWEQRKSIKTQFDSIPENLGRWQLEQITELVKDMADLVYQKNAG